MSWWEPSKEQVNACRQLAQNFRMNAEKNTGEALARQKGENIAKAAYEAAMRRTKELYSASETIDMDKTKNPGFGNRQSGFGQNRQNVVRNMIEIHTHFAGQATQAAMSLGPTLPVALASGTSAAMTLTRMGAAGAGVGSLGLIASVASIVCFAYIIAVFATALSQVAEENKKQREELEAARTKALLEWEKNNPMAGSLNAVNRPRVAR